MSMIARLHLAPARACSDYDCLYVIVGGLCVLVGSRTCILLQATVTQHRDGNLRHCWMIVMAAHELQ